MMAYSIKWSALILILLLSQIGVLSSTGKTPDSTIHIFLNFRGADARDKFAPLLYNGLFRAGFNVFMDEKSIRIGKAIDPSINEAIKRSMGAVMVFSSNYASSDWCLNELVLIIGQRELRSDYILVPLYVDGVQPDDIGEQGGSYGEALAEHKKRCWLWCKKVKLWRDALRQVGGYKGKILSGKWDKCINKIVMERWDTFINEIVEEIRQEFSLLGITVIPRPEPSGMDPTDTIWFGIWGFTAAFTICLSLMIFFGCWKRSKQEKESNEDLDSPRMTEKVRLTTSEQQRSAMASPRNSPTPDPDLLSRFECCENQWHPSTPLLEEKEEEEEESNYLFSPDDAGPESSIIDHTSEAPKKSLVAGASEAPEESLVVGTSEVLNSSMASQNKAPTRIQRKPDPLSGIQECKNQGQPSAPPLESKEEESNHSFSTDDAGLESIIIDSMSEALKKSVIGSTSKAPKKSLVAGTSETQKLTLVSPWKGSTRILPKPDPLCGIQECQNLSRKSASPLKGHDEEESKCSFSPVDAILESSITGSISNTPKKSVIASTSEAPTKIQPKPNPQNIINTKYPPGGEGKVVLYTSFGPIYRTRFDCNEVKDILVDNGVEFEERDSSQNSKFKTELQNLMGGKLSYLRLFVMGRDIGGVKELRNLRDNGQLPNILPIQKLHRKIYSGAACHQPLLKGDERQRRLIPLSQPRMMSE